MGFKKPNTLAAVAGSVAQAEVGERASFLMKTYAHLMGAVFLWVFTMVGMHLALPMSAKNAMLEALMGYSFLLVLLAFAVVSTVAHRWAASGSAGGGTQYAGLVVYALAQALLTYPLVFYAVAYVNQPDVLPIAASLTLGLFAGMTAIVFITGKDFSFLRGALMLGMLALFGVFIAGMVFGFSIGLAFSGFGILLMCGYILYETSAVLHHFRSDQHVAASLVLFSSLATLFWYVLQFVMSSRD